MRAQPLTGDEFAGYLLSEVLGRGGKSTVYRAENPRAGTVIALKVMAPELAEDDIFPAQPGGPGTRHGALPRPGAPRC